MPTAPVLTLEPAIRLFVELGPVIDVGVVPGGHRRIIPITGGTVSGAISGTIISGGADWNLERADGTGVILAVYAMSTHDGQVLTITNEGHGDQIEGAPILTAARIEAPRGGPYNWLNSTPLIGTLVPAEGEPGSAVEIEFWRPRVGPESAIKRQ